MVAREINDEIRVDCAQQEVDPSGSTEQEHQPSALEIGDCWDSFEQNVVGLANVLRMPHWSSQHFHALLLDWEGRVTFPND